LEQQLEAERAKKKRPRPSGDLLSGGASQSPRSGRAAADSAAHVAPTPAPLAPPLAPPLWRQLETSLGGRESAAALRRDLPSVCIVTRGEKR
jgi:hypothetical protein